MFLKSSVSLKQEIKCDRIIDFIRILYTVGFMASFNGRWFDGGYSGHNYPIKSGKTRDYITERK